MLYRKDESPYMNSKPEISLLYDFYGELLQASQQRVIELYVNDDLSLSETAQILGISRQGVRDSLTRAERKLAEYEAKLGLLKAYRARRERNDSIRDIIKRIKSTGDTAQAVSLLDDIEALLKGDD